MVLTVVLLVALTPCLIHAQEFGRTRDYGLLDKVSGAPLYSRCRQASRLDVQCTADNSYCVLKNVVIHNKVISVACLLSNDTNNKVQGGWTSELERSVYRPTTSCTHYPTTLDTVMFVKGDLLNNLYHHFNTLLHAYASYLVTTKRGLTDVTVALWDLKPDNSPFRDMWRIFDNFYEMNLNTTVVLCIKRVVLGLQTRQKLDLLWSPLPADVPASGSEMLKDIAAKMSGAVISPYTGEKPSLLYSKRTTKHRNILNEGDIIKALRVYYRVTVLDMAQLEFSRQLEHVKAHHILLGVHGAGLTHAAFLTKPAALFELYNAGQEDCYRSLAALFGVGYFTLQREHVDVVYGSGGVGSAPHSPPHSPPRSPPHSPPLSGWVSPKEADYFIDPGEVVRTVENIVRHLGWGSRTKEEL